MGGLVFDVGRFSLVVFWAFGFSVLLFSVCFGGFWLFFCFRVVLVLLYFGFLCILVLGLLGLLRFCVWFVVCFC